MPEHWDTQKNLQSINIVYLNIGTGYACAGQFRAKFCPEFRIKYPTILSALEKAGALTPTGSDKKIKYII